MNGYNTINRRTFLKQSTAAATLLSPALAASSLGLSSKSGRNDRHKIIILGIDGMDPNLSEKLMNAGRLPNFAKLRAMGGFKKLGTSTPPQSPVAWASFMNGAGPGSHGVFDFIHRDPEKQSSQSFACFSAAETVESDGGLDIGDHRIPLSFWPFNDTSAQTRLRRRGVPFWDYLDAKGINSAIYNIPSNFPPSESKHGHHKSLAGMGTTDLLGTYGTYQFFAEDGPYKTVNKGGGMHSLLFFENETAKAKLHGPMNTFLKKPEPAMVDFAVHRDTHARTAVIEIQGHKILLKEGQWSDWKRVHFKMRMPALMPDEKVTGICRIFLQEVEPNLRLYISPINSDPSDSALIITEPKELIKDISNELGLFYTTGFQEDHKALTNGVFSDDEYINQAELVLQERLNLLNYTLDHYNDGVLYFYFSSTDMQAHMLWWDSNDKHPTRNQKQSRECFDVLKDIYVKLDAALGRVLKDHGDEATIICLSDHGFGEFKRQFNLNTWLRDNGYIHPASAYDLKEPLNWGQTKAYGMGINSLYLNLRGREGEGIIKPGEEREELLAELTGKLEAIRDDNGEKVIRKVYRSDKEFSGEAVQDAPDLIIGYAKNYRASWDTCLGGISEEVLTDNDMAWAADHCSDPHIVPGVLFCNKPIRTDSPRLEDLAPSILAEYGIETPSTMTGKKILG